MYRVGFSFFLRNDEALCSDEGMINFDASLKGVDS